MTDIADFAYVPTDGIKNTTSFPTTPTSNAAARKQIQDLLDQVKTYLNSTLTDGVNTHLNDDVTLKTVHGLRIESGTFTVVIKGTTTAGTNTYSKQAGFYYKVGKQVFITLLVSLTAKDAAMAGNVRIGGLPFPSKSDTNARFAMAIGDIENFDLDATRNILTAFITTTSSDILLVNNGDNLATSFVASSQITATTALVISGTYLTD